jgi:hypothetical protein
MIIGPTKYDNRDIKPFRWLSLVIFYGWQHCASRAISGGHTFSRQLSIANVGHFHSLPLGGFWRDPMVIRNKG